MDASGLSHQEGVANSDVRRCMGRTGVWEVEVEIRSLIGGVLS